MATYQYLRVSTDLQTVENQRKVIRDSGFAVDGEFCDEGVSGGIIATARKGFSAMMCAVRPGDQVLCTMVDRLGRNAGDILHTIEEFKRLNVKLRILQFDGIDVTSSMGKMIITVMAALGEMEKAVLVERVVAGIARTREQGTTLGQPLKITPQVMSHILKRKSEGATTDILVAETGLRRSCIAQNAKKYKGAEGLRVYTEKYNKAQIQYSAAKSVDKFSATM